MEKNKQEKVFTIRAYCSKCKKLLLESHKLTRRELMVNWDDAVIKAANIECKDCDHKVPNFYIDLKIYNSASKLEFHPRKIFPESKFMKSLRNK